MMGLDPASDEAEATPCDTSGNVEEVQDVATLFPYSRTAIIVIEER